MRTQAAVTGSGADTGWTRWAPWIVIGVTAVVAVITAEPGTGHLQPLVVLVGMSLFFATLMLRLLSLIATRPAQRRSLTALLAAIVLFCIGAIVLAAGGAAIEIALPSPSEVLFLASYVALAAFVFLDAQPSIRRRTLGAWADAAILTGAAAAVASVVLLSPFARAYADAEWTALIVTMLYPLIDVLLAITVLGQWALGMRSGRGRTGLLLAGLVLLAVADASLPLDVPGGAYDFTLLVDLMWGVAFALIVEGACRPRSLSRPVERQVHPALVLAGFVTAVLLLAARPSGPVGVVLMISAGVVILACAVRLVLAWRGAQSMSRDVRLSAVDPVTGLASRRGLLRDLDERLAAGQIVGLLVLDVVAFKDVNEVFGHEAGDVLLCDVAARLADALPANTTMARLGSDEFAIRVPTGDDIVLGELAASLRSAVAAAPFRVDGTPLSIRARVGWASPGEPSSAMELLRRAVLAVDAARSAGVPVEQYRPGGEETARRRLQMAEDLRAALRSGALDVWYQPVASSATGVVDRVEALVRWDHPEEGMVPPAVFLPLARREGLMLDLSMAVAQRVASDLAHWRRSGLDVSASLNVAAAELLGDVYVSQLLGVLRERAVPAQRVVLEVTEDAFLTDPDGARRILADARQSGLRLSIDHYGAGFSSLSYIRDLPVGEVKLDRAFFAAVCTDARSAVIVKSTVEMAHALGMSVVAEGIETEEVAYRAVVLGVDGLQGRYLAEPMRADAVPRLVRYFALQAPTA